MQKYIKLIFVLFLNTINFAFVKAQTDTNIIYCNSLLYEGKMINKVVNGKKEGLHITFDFKGEVYRIHSDGIDDEGNWWGETEVIYYSIRPIFDSITGKLITEPIWFRAVNSDTIITNFWTNNITQVSKGNYNSDQRIGKWTYLIGYDNLYRYNSPYVIGEYNNGIKEGTWRYYYSDGELMAEVYYENNSPSRPIDIFNKSGKVIKKLFPIDKGIFLEKTVNENGEIVKKDTTLIKDYRLIFE